MGKIGRMPNLTEEERMKAFTIGIEIMKCITQNKDFDLLFIPFDSEYHIVGKKKK